jgi:hypothetical protein
MTPLRQRMIEDLQLRGLSERTQEMYVRAVRQLADHYHKSPDRITEEERRDHFLYLKNVKHYSRSASTIALCGIKFFYAHTLQRESLLSGYAETAHNRGLSVTPDDCGWHRSTKLCWSKRFIWRRRRSCWNEMPNPALNRRNAKIR